MGRYVDTNGLKQTFCAECNHSIKCEDCDIEYHFKHFPTADVVEVVRCRDCKHYRKNISCVSGLYNGCSEWLNEGNEIEVREDDYCSYGERREDAEVH